MHAYRDAGVDIDRGDKFVDFIKRIPSPAVHRGIGGFSSALPLEGFQSPVLLTTTDGTGTKLLVAKKLGVYDTIGIDLVAMNVNDLLVCGAKPMVFLDYIACGRIHEDRMHALMYGIVRGCELAGCKLGGGETAEMPDAYGFELFIERSLLKIILNFFPSLLTTIDLLQPLGRFSHRSISCGLDLLESRNFFLQRGKSLKPRFYLFTQLGIFNEGFHLLF